MGKKKLLTWRGSEVRSARSMFAHHDASELLTLRRYSSRSGASAAERDPGGGEEDEDEEDGGDEGERELPPLPPLPPQLPSPPNKSPPAPRSESVSAYASAQATTARMSASSEPIPVKGAPLVLRSHFGLD